MSDESSRELPPPDGPPPGQDLPQVFRPRANRFYAALVLLGPVVLLGILARRYHKAQFARL